MSGLLRYYQTLIKSIPATINMAEGYFIDKIELMRDFPSSVESLKKLILEQKELAQKIQKHLIFFSRLNQQKDLDLPDRIQEALQRSMTYVIRYEEILQQQSEALETKNDQSFVQAYLNERKITYGAIGLVEKSIHFSLTFKDLLNKAVESTELFFSPVSKILQTIYFTIVSVFPTEAVEIFPGVIKPDQAKILSPKVDMEEFAKNLIRRGWVVRLITGNPESPLVILKEDIHGSPEIEWDFVNYVLVNFKINLVALEGWAGEKEDLQRGKTVLNAEVGLIKRLLPDSAFYKMGLEDAYLQDEVLKIVILNNYFKYTEGIQKQQKCIEELEKEIKENSEKINRLITKKELTAEEQKKLVEYRDLMMSNESMVMNYKRMLPIVKSSKEETMEWAMKLLNEYKTTISEISRLYDYLLEKPEEEIKKIVDNVMIEIRSRRWAEKIAMLKFNSIIAVMGAGHTETFLKHIKQQGDFNIIIVPHKKGIDPHMYLGILK